MSGLTKKDMSVLWNYADKGNRELYWNYLAQLPGNDGYGLLALGVVRNDNMPGAVANAYAQQHGGRKLSEREWENFGQQLIKEDFKRRRLQFEDRHNPHAALNLPVKDVQDAHDKTFTDNGLDRDAWTPRRLLEAARKQDGELAAEDVWSNMLDNSWKGLSRGGDTVNAIRRYMPVSEAAGYTARLGVATLMAQNSRDAVDPDVIGGDAFHYRYSPRDRSWSSITEVRQGGLPVIRAVTDPSTLRELNDVRQLRLERQEKARQFHPDDPYRDIAQSPRTIAQVEPADTDLRASPAPSLPPGFAPALQAPADIRHAGHPGHHAFADALDAVHRMEAGNKITSGAHSEVLAARLAAEAIERGQGITHVELGRDGQIHVIERHYALESGKRFSIPGSAAIRDNIEQSSSRWLQASSPHHAAPPAGARSAEQTEALARLGPEDRVLFAHIRAGVPARIDDDIVSRSMVEAKRAGIHGPDDIRLMGLNGNALYISGNFPGRSAVTDVSQPARSLAHSLEASSALSQQREHYLIQPQPQQEQDRVQSQGRSISMV